MSFILEESDTQSFRNYLENVVDAALGEFEDRGSDGDFIGTMKIKSIVAQAKFAE